MISHSTSGMNPFVDLHSTIHSPIPLSILAEYNMSKVNSYKLVLLGRSLFLSPVSTQKSTSENESFDLDRYPLFSFIASQANPRLVSDFAPIDALG